MDFSQEIWTMLLAILPVTEIRASIPIAMTVYGLSVASAFFWSVLGNILITYPLLSWLPPLADFFSRKEKFIARAMHWIFERTRDRAVKKYLKYGKWALVIFVGIPLPGTGAWTGALIAYLLDIPKAQAFWLISAGIMIAGVLVALATLGVITSVNIF